MNNSKDNDTKKQHFVPRFYLKLFGDDSHILQTLDVKNNRLCSPKSYRALGFEYFFYAVNTGIPDDISQSVEQWLSEYENIVSREIPKIIEKILTNKHIDDDDRYILSVFLSMLWLRSPNMRFHLNEMEEDMRKKIMGRFATDRVEHYIEKTGIEMAEKKRMDLIQIMKTGNYKLRFNNVQHLKFMTRNLGYGAPGFANMFFGQKWKIYIAKGKQRFITSDSPVIEYWDPPETFYGASFSERNKYFALTPEIFFELTYPMGSKKVKRKTIFKEEDDIVSLFNILIAAHSHKFAYSGNKELLNNLISGRDKQGILEKTYYERFELPWAEAKKSGRI